MPNDQELAVIKDYTGRDALLDNTGERLTPAEIMSKYPIQATQTGYVSSMPNTFWAMERELDASFEFLMALPEGTSDLDKGKAMGECRGAARIIAMLTGMTVEEVTMAAVRRRSERHNI